METITRTAASFLSFQPKAKRVKLNLQPRADQEHDRSCVIDLSDDDDDDDKDNDKSTSETKHTCSSSNSRVIGVSLVDTFTAEEIQVHLRSLRDPLSKGSDPADSGHNCQLCGKDKFLFHVLAKDCDSCGRIIKTGSSFYTTADTKYCFCASCVMTKKKNLCVTTRAGVSFPKLELYVGVSEEPQEEGWVQCDNCQHWLHQVCALFNDLLDSGGELRYVCPHCRLLEQHQQVKEGALRPPLGARDLPRTKLSDHIEKRLVMSLARERMQRATSLGLTPHDIPGAEDIVVRVVLSVDKEIKVKQQFLDILHGEIYPSEFPYKSKAIMLFQRIQGADVCIFAMYVQEFGSDCGQPNQRSIYISYLDSVRYFLPDVRTVSGEALRTFVYHQVLIGYLDYCKNRGFNTCYIWACPPLKGDDYILYCHPETQKTPKPKKLLKWYETMLKRASEEKVVAGYTSFYDHFLVQKGNTKVTTARLPYFDGAYWTGAIEDTIGHSQKVKKPTLKRTFLSMGHNDLSPEAEEDIQVMKELEQRMLPVKENFIVVHLRSPMDAAADTKETDVGFDNDILQTRLAFLDFCKGKHYQFDTLRRAKHSSMMILYHLHKNTVPIGNIHRQDGPSAKVKSVLEVLSHASHCQATRRNPCPHPKCLEVKTLFHHAVDCKIQLSGRCNECTKLWSLIRLHSRYCQDSSCSIPRCMEVKRKL